MSYCALEIRILLTFLYKSSLKQKKIPPEKSLFNQRKIIHGTVTLQQQQQQQQQKYWHVAFKIAFITGVR